jgi:hypothetical protein
MAPLARDETLPILSELLPGAANMDRDELDARVSELAGHARAKRHDEKVEWSSA